MRIYNEIVFDVDGKVTYEDSFEYSGDVMLCQNWDEVNILDIVAMVQAILDTGDLGSIDMITGSFIPPP